MVFILFPEVTKLKAVMIGSLESNFEKELVSKFKSQSVEVSMMKIHVHLIGLWTVCYFPVLGKHRKLNMRCALDFIVPSILSSIHFLFPSDF